MFNYLKYETIQQIEIVYNFVICDNDLIYELSIRKFKD